MHGESYCETEVLLAMDLLFGFTCVVKIQLLSELKLLSP